MLLAAACAASEPIGSGLGSGTSTGADASTGATAEASTTTTSESTSGSGSSGTEASSAETMPAEGMPPPPPKSCALAVIDPAADPAVVIDAGDGVGQIPTVIGEVLLGNCGCHYNTNNLLGSGYIDYTSNKQPMATWADFHVDFGGTFPVGFSRMPAHAAIERRVVFFDPLPMPPYGCGVEGEEDPNGVPSRISAADLALLTDWLAADAPDGASYPAR